MRRPATPIATRALLIGVALVAYAGIAPGAFAQDSGTVYVRLDYVSVTPGEEAPYLALERDVWRPVHEERRRRGDLLNWMIYDVEFAPPGLAYSHVVASVHSDLANAETVDLSELVQAVHPGQSPDAVLARTASARRVVHSELWALVSNITPEGAEAPAGRHLAVNFMSVPENGRAEYFSVENEVWAPIHQVRADDGSMGGWALYSLVLPRGEVLDYQFGTVDFFDGLDAAAAQITGGQIRQAHPGATELEVDAMLDRTDAARSIYKTEIWTLVGSLDPPVN